MPRRTGIAHALADIGVGRGRSGAVVGRHLTRGDPRVRRAGEAGSGLRAVERTRVDRGDTTGRRVRAPTAVAGRCVAPRRRGGARDRVGDLVRRSAVRRSERDSRLRRRAPPVRDVDERDAHVIFFTSGSTGRPKGVVLSHRTNWLRTYPGATTTTAEAAPSACSRCSTWPAGRSRSVLGKRRRPVHFVRVPDAETLCATTARHHAARLYCIPAVWARVLEHPRAPPRPRVAGRSRHRYVGDPTRVARTRSRTCCPGP